MNWSHCKCGGIFFMCYYCFIQANSGWPFRYLCTGHLVKDFFIIPHNFTIAPPFKSKVHSSTHGQFSEILPIDAVDSRGSASLYSWHCATDLYSAIIFKHPHSYSRFWWFFRLCYLNHSIPDFLYCLLLFISKYTGVKKPPYKIICFNCAGNRPLGLQYNFNTYYYCFCWRENSLAYVVQRELGICIGVSDCAGVNYCNCDCRGQYKRERLDGAWEGS